MEKMFYTLEEAAAKLGRSTDDVRDMAKSGQLQEFRDRDKLMFKREQVDLLSGGRGGDNDIIPLAGDSGELEPISLASSGSSAAMSLSKDEKESTGISIFEAEDTDDGDPSAVTRVSAAQGGMVDPGEDPRSASGSGGLLDLTREGDDTSLGANLLDDVYGSDTLAQQTAIEPSQGGGDLFESPAGGTEVGAGASAVGGLMMMPEAYDGAGSGLVGGLAIGMIVSASIAAFTVIMGITSSYGGGMVSKIGENFTVVLGVMAGVTLLGGILGWVLGRRS